METGKLYYKIWLADFCQLTTRPQAKSAWNKKHYSPDFEPDVKNRGKRKVGIGHIPKWIRYAFRGTKYQISKVESIPVYPSPIWIFVIEDRDSKRILHACLRQEEKPSYYSHFPNFFDIRACLLETFEKHGKPYGFISDGQILKRYATELVGIRTIRAKLPKYMASLESFFSRLQFDMRTELSQEELERYVDFWNSTHAREIPYTRDKAFVLVPD